jgi:hypothetical protein
MDPKNSCYLPITCRYGLKNHEVTGEWADQVEAVNANASDFEIRADDFANIVLEGLHYKGESSLL